MYTTKNRVGASHADENGLLKLTSALDFIQDCELFWLETAPALTEFFSECGAAMVLAFRKVDIPRMPGYGECLTVSTAVYYYKDYYGYRTTNIYDGQGNPCVKTWGVGVMIDTGSGCLRKVPAEVAARVKMDDPPGFDPPSRRILPPDAPPESLAGIPVRPDYIDINKHVNNVRYIDAVTPLLPPGFTASALRVEYKTAAKLGGTLYPVRRVSPEGVTHIALNNERGRPYAAMEFTPL